MLAFLIHIVLAGGHPTDDLAVSSHFQKDGLQVIVGGNITGILSGQITDDGEKRSLIFANDGQAPDIQANDQIHVAFLPIVQRGGNANVSISMGSTILWQDQIPIGSERHQFFLKIFVKGEHGIVSVDTFDVDANTPVQSGDVRPPKPPKIAQEELESPRISEARKTFYENPLFLQFLSSILFLGLGFFIGQRYRYSSSLPIEYWSTKSTTTIFSVPILGQQQAWSLSAQSNRSQQLLTLGNQLIAQGLVLLIVSDETRKDIEKVPAAGRFVCSIQRPNLATISSLCTELQRLGTVILLIDGIDSLEAPQDNEKESAVLKDLLYELPSTISVLALVKETDDITISHHLE